MSNFEGKILNYAVLHGAIHTPETGQFGPVLQSWSDSARKATKMTQLAGEVMLEVPSVKNPNKILRFLVDNSGFTHRVLDETNSK